MTTRVLTWPKRQDRSKLCIVSLSKVIIVGPTSNKAEVGLGYYFIYGVCLFYGQCGSVTKSVRIYPHIACDNSY